MWICTAILAPTERTMLNSHFRQILGVFCTAILAPTERTMLELANDSQFLFSTIFGELSTAILAPTERRERIS